MNIANLLAPTFPVALSRAREGLYIFGHAQNLSSRSPMWRKIVEELEEKGLIGPALPIACYRHSDVVKYVSEPGQLPQMAPDGSLYCQTLSVIINTHCHIKGGCLENCEIRLNCGHLCPFKVGLNYLSLKTKLIIDRNDL